MKKSILDTFEKLGADYSLSGYKYICEAVDMLCETSQPFPICQLYALVGVKFNTTGSRVERAIRHFIDRAISYGNVEFIHSIINFPGHKYKPTNSQFICGIVEYIRRQQL